MSSFHRYWLALVAAGFGWSSVALGQTGTSSTPSGTQGSSSTQGSSLGSPGNSSSVFGSGSGSSSSFNVFSSAPQTPAPDTSSTPTTPTATESTATAGTGGGSSRGQSEASPSFTVPGFYGQGSTTFFGGSGRLARPKFETSLTFGFGYDDNVTQTPRNTPDVSPGVSQVVQPGKEVVVQSGTAFVAGQLFNTTTPVYTTVRTPDTIVDVPLPASTQERVSSLFTRAGLQLEMQSFTRRSLFVLNATGNETYYFNKDKDPNEFSGSLNLTYLYKLTPRLQMTAQLNSAYISQPDLSRPNTPERQTQGDLINSLARLDVSYRLTPRVSLTLTGNYSGNRYTEKAEQTGDFDEFTTGLELRYLWKPRWTLLAEVRHGITNYLQTTDLDSTTDYLLVGSEFILNPRLSGSFRLGEALKTFDQSGDSQSAPYVESSITYKSTARSSVQWTNRFGFEEPGSPNEERLVYRSTASYNYMFSPKLRGSLAANLVHEITTNDLTDTKFAQDTFEGTLGLEYQWTKFFSLNASYTFTLVNTNTGLTDYYRNRCFLGGQYSF